MASEAKGRTILDILLGRNKPDKRPTELKYHNPLGLKVGSIVEFDHEEELKGIGFSVERIIVYETKVGGDKFFHVDYCLKGISTTASKPLRFRLRLMEDEDATNEVGCILQLLQVFYELPFDQGLVDMLNANGDHDDKYDEPGETTFKVNYDDQGKELETPRRYWRIEGVPNAYKASVSDMKDDDKSGSVSEDEVKRYSVTYWDFSRLTEDDGDQEMTEYLTAELKDKTITVLRGPEVKAFQVHVQGV
jgi:hypothetical protein